MKLKKYLPLFGIAFLTYLAFVENISVNLGSDGTYIDQEEFFKQNYPTMREFTKEESDENSNCSFVDLADFDRFLNEESILNYHYKNEQYLDTTGDGDKEVVKTSVEIIDGTCRVNQQILKHGKHIWNESFAFNKADLSFYFGEKAFTDEESLSALFYLGLSHSKFTEKMSNPEGYPERLQLLTGNYFRDSNLLEKDKLNSEFMKELRAYKGYYVFKRHSSDLGIYIWDKSNEAFVEVFKPESSV